MRHEAEVQAILKQVELWPAEERFALAREISDQASTAVPRSKPTIDQLVGAGRGDGPAPSDDEVRRWRDEHLQQKYGQ